MAPQRPYFGFFCPILPERPDTSLPTYPWLYTAHALQPGLSVAALVPGIPVATYACFLLSPESPGQEVAGGKGAQVYMCLRVPGIMGI